MEVLSDTVGQPDTKTAMCSDCRDHDRFDTGEQFDPTPSVADVAIDDLPIEEIADSEYYGVQAGAEHLVADGGCDSTESTIVGKLGELCFAKYLPGSHDVDTDAYGDGDDGGWDFRFGGKTWDVKTVRQGTRTPDLIVDATQRLRADRYALANRLGPTVCRIVGYSPWPAVKNRPIEFSGNQSYRKVPREKLRPFPSSLSH